MKSKRLKLLALLLFVVLFSLATWFMYTRYVTKSPYLKDRNEQQR